jgi:hypothetical protein
MIGLVSYSNGISLYSLANCQMFSRAYSWHIELQKLIDGTIEKFRYDLETARMVAI